MKIEVTLKFVAAPVCPNFRLFANQRSNLGNIQSSSDFKWPLEIVVLES